MKYYNVTVRVQSDNDIEVVKDDIVKALAQAGYDPFRIRVELMGES